jgi:hypothetical protein
MAKVLLCGAYFADRKSRAAVEIEEFAASRHHIVEQRWMALHFGEGDVCELSGTVSIIRQPTPKFTLMNRMISDVEAFEYLIIADDDVHLPRGFVDDFLAYVTKFRFALSQPARTPESYIDHFITMCMPGLGARLTRFVEIGPIFCIHRSAFGVLLPFDQRSPMGWGYDFVWPTVIERHGLRMGIVDATPVGHTMRASVTNYTRRIVVDQMESLLQACPHLPRADAYTVLEAYD